MKRVFLGLVTCALLVSATTHLQRTKIYPHVDHGIDEELLYFPNENLLSHFTAGMSNVIADVMWIRAINYASREFASSEKKFTWFNHMCRVVTDLDPYYEAAYQNGAVILAALGKDEEALQLLHKGAVSRPDSFPIAFELVKVYLLNRKDWDGAQAMVLHHLTHAAERSDDPEFYLDWMDRIRIRGNLEGEAERAWLTMLETAEDDIIRNIARVQLAVIQVERVRASIARSVVQFESDRGRPPASLEELYAAGYHLRPLEDELHGRYYRNTTGEIRNTVTDARVVKRVHDNITKSIAAFQRKHDRLPNSREELETYRRGALPKHPLGWRWQYDPATGEIQAAPPESDAG